MGLLSIRLEVEGLVVDNKSDDTDDDVVVCLAVLFIPILNKEEKLMISQHCCNGCIKKGLIKSLLVSDKPRSTILPLVCSFCYFQFRFSLLSCCCCVYLQLFRFLLLKRGALDSIVFLERKRKARAGKQASPSEILL